MGKGGGPNELIKTRNDAGVEYPVEEKKSRSLDNSGWMDGWIKNKLDEQIPQRRTCIK